MEVPTLPPAAVGVPTGRLAALLPLVYVAWADGVLGPTELDEARAAAARLNDLSDDDRARLESWLDPQSPPDAVTYHRWGRALRHAAGRLASASASGDGQAAGGPLTLTDLGEALAVLVGERATPETRAALQEVEEALGESAPAAREALEALVADRAPAPVPDLEPAPFDTEALHGMLSVPHPDIRERVMTLLQDPVFSYDPPLDTSAARARVFYWLKLLAEQGLGALAYPKYAGGEGSFGKFMATFETLAYHDLSLLVKYGVQFGLFGGAISQLGSERHRREYLPDVGSLELPGCFAMSEFGHGSNVRELETTATYDPETETFEIDTPHDAARKEWIGNAARHGRLAAVFAQLKTDGEEYGVHAFLVPIRDDAGHPMPGVRIADCGEKMGLNGVDNGRLWFDKVRVPRENLLDRFAQVDADGTYSSPIPSEGRRFFTMLSTLVGGRIAVGSAGLSASKSGLTIAIRYGARRRQFGPKDGPETLLLDYRTHRQRLLPRLATTYGLHFALHTLGADFASHVKDGETSGAGDLHEIETRAAALKAFATWHNTDTLQEAREACGGQGYLWDNRLAALKRDSEVFTTFEGDNTVLMLQVAKNLLSGYRAEFQNMDLVGLVRFVAGGLFEKLGDLNPIPERRVGSDHLRDARFQSDAFHTRERRLLVSAGRRLKGRMGRGKDPYDAFIAVQDHLLELGWAHAKRLTHDAFCQAVDEASPAMKAVLTPLRDLYALAHLEEDRAWFLERGIFSPEKAKAIRDEVNALVDEVRPNAVGLVDAFGIPDAVLAAPIALGASPVSDEDLY
jgi:acyl-CoA oxidase